MNIYGIYAIEELPTPARGLAMNVVELEELAQSLLIVPKKPPQRVVVRMVISGEP